MSVEKDNVSVATEAAAKVVDNEAAATETVASEQAGEAAAATATNEATEDGEIAAIRSEKILKAKELFNQGSRNYVVKSYSEAADDLSEACTLYEELYGELCKELAMPYLMYAKSLISLAMDEGKIIDVPNKEDGDNDDEDDDAEEDEAVEDGEGDEAEEDGGEDVENGGEAEATALEDNDAKAVKTNGEISPSKSAANKKLDAISEEMETKTDDETDHSSKAEQKQPTKESKTETAISGSEENSVKSNDNASSHKTEAVVNDGEKPSTSNGDATGKDGDEDDDENQATSNLQIAWELLELAKKIFQRDGDSALPDLAEVHTELGNISFENSNLDGAREDYEIALTIYGKLPNASCRNKAEIHYKIGLTYMMQQMHKEAAVSLKEACNLIANEIELMKSKSELSDKEKKVIKELEETKDEIWAKINEVEEVQAQTIAEVRAALDNYIKPLNAAANKEAESSTSPKSSSLTSTDANSMEISSTSSSAAASASAAKPPNDISHLIKRKRPSDDTEGQTISPAKRPAA